MICRVKISRGLESRSCALALPVFVLAFVFHSIQASDVNVDSDQAELDRSESAATTVVATQLRNDVIDAVGLAGELALSGRFSESRTILNLLLATNPNDAEKELIHHQSANLYTAKGDLVLAASAFNSLLSLKEQLSPNIRQQALYDLSKVYMKQEETVLALRTIERWLEIVPQLSPDEYFYVGQIHYAARRFAVALKYVELAVSSAEKKDLPIGRDWLKLARYLNDKRGNKGRVSQIDRILASRGTD